MEEWSEDGTIELRNPRESIDLGPTNEIEEEGFDGVVEVVSGEDILGPVLLSDLLEEEISFGSGGLLDSFLGFLGDALDIGSTEDGSEGIFLTKILHRELISIALRSSEMMIEMSDDDMISRMESENFRHEEHTVGTSGTSDDECVIGRDMIFCKESF